MAPHVVYDNVARPDWAYGSLCCRKLSNATWVPGYNGQSKIRSWLSERSTTGKADESLEERRKLVLFFTVFSTTITYLAGLSPPGGFWPDSEDDHQAGDFVLRKHYQKRFQAFFYCNMVAFVASLVTVLLLLSKKLSFQGLRSNVIKVCVAINLFGLMGAYAAGSSRDLDVSIYVIALIIPVFLYIMMQVAINIWATGMPTEQASAGDDAESDHNIQDGLASMSRPPNEDCNISGDNSPSQATEQNAEEHPLDGVRSYLVLLAVMAASITFQAGLNPPGGWWSDEQQGDFYPGRSILQVTNPARYNVFFYCNTTAFVASLVIIVLLQSKKVRIELIRTSTLQTLLIVVMFGLMGAYTAGSSRTVISSIYMCILAGAVFLYVGINIIVFMFVPSSWMHKFEEMFNQPSTSNHQNLKKSDRERKALLILAVLVASVTYQAGLMPPGGFWADSSDGHQIGDPVIRDADPKHYETFFYLNATSFMASLTIVMLLARNTIINQGPASSALRFCMIVTMCSLLGSYAAGSSLKIKSSIYTIALAFAVFIYIVVQVLILKKQSSTSMTDLPTSRQVVAGDDDSHKHEAARTPQDKAAYLERKNKYLQRKRILLLGTLAATVTYQAGLNPSGGIWLKNNTEHLVGDPILRETNLSRWHVFFCCNATAFIASIVVIVMLMSRVEQQKHIAALKMFQPKHFFTTLKTVMILDLLGLLGAYAAGSCRKLSESAYVAALCIAVIIFLGAHLLLSFKGDAEEQNQKLQQSRLAAVQTPMSTPVQECQPLARN